MINLANLFNFAGFILPSFSNFKFDILIFFIYDFYFNDGLAYKPIVETVFL